MVSKNNVIQSVHLRKHWNQNTSQKGLVRTYFDQAGKKLRRRIHRFKKARKIFPRPFDGEFRPVIHCPTQRYNMKVREGRGYSLAELKKAKISQVMAKRFCISIDHRRRTERLENINRLKAYRSRIIVNPAATEKKQLRGQILKISGDSKRVAAIDAPKRKPKVKKEKKPKVKKERKQKKEKKLLKAVKGGDKKGQKKGGK
ncbi:putative 60S ribosomal protein L13e [Monocercomonoides exilis]|uniref:putative 60S ribosomal protein L13e n=1 Tax=Monocercomonoides exilis TaxID=2049356 RepID=UPI003559A58D|nr:putative 60S ribosomal protein L13e [Monocercomonoides exilis]KAH7828767.1 putative 60S ribosomal protein L13e [Monocercomonoides exilis]|eukprot:MONOS_11281.1-p1 / transcript=MONOS_11281.1 / gene=MONOS_11281 / organism=Monocercomonoides_exilis_PA203 / gene_product=60S ribosomal protein L13e / transcript_product=60S ribosomal protein L13e / location=Mono_scaffold00558:7937-8739(+) / protein_length=201 / sequence_SO=supercontig / SO=protein_coding / is_pseudo=false